MNVSSFLIGYQTGKNAGGGSSGGGGGGTLPPGAYWKTLDIPYANSNYAQQWFVFNGELYAFVNKTTGSSPTKYVYKLVNGAWSTVYTSSTDLTFSNADDIPWVKFNGKIHMVGGESSEHYTFDGTSIQKMADLPNWAAYQSIFVQNNLLKFYSFYDGNVYVWNETDDTWTLEATIGSKYLYLGFATVNNTTYCCKSTVLYTYSNGELIQVATGKFSVSRFFVFNGKIYTSKSVNKKPDMVLEFDPATLQLREIGYLPAKNDVGRFWEYQGKLCVTHGGSNKDYTCGAALYEATE
jgi:hypothetical protein